MSASQEYCLYRITNNQNGDFYIGMTSRDINSRWKEHIRHASKKINNGHFYRAINKYGSDNFSINIICKEKTKKAAIESEVLLILDMSPAYNSTLGGDGTWAHKITSEGRKKMSSVHMGNKYNLGRKWSEFQKKAMSDKKKGCAAPPLSEKMQKSRAENMRKSAASRRKLVLCINDSAVYASLSEASAAYSLDKSSVSQVCLGKRNSIFGLKFEYVGGGN